MSVPQSLLAILTQGPCYGYQLRGEFDRRTGADQSLNVGQIYRTLERLERDGFVTRGEPDAQGHVYWRITEAGAADVAEWFATPAVHRRGASEDVPAKVALAATLDGVEVTGVIGAHRSAARAELTRLEAAVTAAEEEGSLPRLLVLRARLERVGAELRWLDETETELRRHPDRALPIGLATDRPRRGRPPRG
jgi:DNA-binding PadR family transcriptional regulator